MIITRSALLAALDKVRPAIDARGVLPSQAYVAIDEAKGKMWASRNGLFVGVDFDSSNDPNKKGYSVDYQELYNAIKPLPEAPIAMVLDNTMLSISSGRAKVDVTAWPSKDVSVMKAKEGAEATLSKKDILRAVQLSGLTASSAVSTPALECVFYNKGQMVATDRHVMGVIGGCSEDIQITKLLSRDVLGALSAADVPEDGVSLKGNTVSWPGHVIRFQEVDALFLDYRAIIPDSTLWPRATIKVSDMTTAIKIWGVSADPTTNVLKVSLLSDGQLVISAHTGDQRSSSYSIDVEYSDTPLEFLINRLNFSDIFSRIKVEEATLAWPGHGAFVEVRESDDVVYYLGRLQELNQVK